MAQYVRTVFHSRGVKRAGRGAADPQRGAAPAVEIQRADDFAAGQALCGAEDAGHLGQALLALRSDEKAAMTVRLLEDDGARAAARVASVVGTGGLRSHEKRAGLPGPPRTAGEGLKAAVRVMATALGVTLSTPLREFGMLERVNLGALANDQAQRGSGRGRKVAAIDPREELQRLLPRRCRDRRPRSGCP